jgi:hypothetical protein
MFTAMPYVIDTRAQGAFRSTSMAARRLLPLQHEKIDYHVALRRGDPATVSQRGKSRCPADLLPAEAQEMLTVGYRDETLPSGYPKRVFAKRRGVWYRALAHAEGRYHGCPVAEQFVPPEARNTKQARWER